MKREHSYFNCIHSKGIVVVPLIFGVMLLGILGVAITWEVYNAQVSSVDVAEMHQVYAVAQSGIEFAIRYASDSLAQRRALYSPGQTRTLPSSAAFPGGRFTVVFNPSTDTLTSTATLIGSSAKRELALMNFMRNYVKPDFPGQFNEPPDQFDKQYFAVARGWEATTTVLSGIDDPSQPWLEQAFTMAGESNPDIRARSGYFTIGFPWDIFIPGEQEYIMIFPTTPGTGKLTINGLERTGLPVELEEGYQNYSVEVKFSLGLAIPQPDQGFGIIFRLHHPTLPLGGPWNNTDLDYTLFYALQIEPRIGKPRDGGFFVRWWAPDPSLGGRATDEGLCGGEPLYFNEDYCKEQELTPSGLVDVYKGGYFFPENPDYSTCQPSAPNNPGWGWRDVSRFDNAWFNCDFSRGDSVPDMHILRVDVFKNKFTVYFGTEHGIKCDNTDSFVMHKIMEIDVAEERTRRGACVPDYRKGHIGLRAWNGFQAQVDYIKVWRW